VRKSHPIVTLLVIFMTFLILADRGFDKTLFLCKMAPQQRVSRFGHQLLSSVNIYRLRSCYRRTFWNDML